MEFAILFLAFVLLVVAFAAAICAANFLLDPFASNKEVIAGLVFLLGLTPLFASGSVTVFSAYTNYCPSFGPIAEPELAEVITDDGVPIIVASPDQDELQSLIADLFETERRLEVANNEVSLKTTALQTASETILELQNRIKTLESTRIKAQVPTPTPITTRPTAVPAGKPHCNRPGGCN